MTVDASIGPELPGLEFQRKLGSGGFSDVYLYERQRPRMQVAVKVLKADVMDAAQQAQFVAEADTMGELAEHPYIVPVLGAGTAPDGRPFLEMRYYPGPDLAERVKAQPLSVADAIKMGIQLASAIETAHRAGIIHRDIKPQNVLISSYGVPGLTDFGIAGRPGEVEEDDNVGVSMPWSPPEVLTGASNGSQASDVYSLGATIWNLLVGRSPFSLPGDDNSQRALFTRIVHSKPPSTGRGDVPSSLERLLTQAMAKKPEHRPRTAMDLARHLQRVEQELRLARTEIVVLEHGHEQLAGGPADPQSHTPVQTLPDTVDEQSDRTTVRPTAPVPPAPAPAATTDGAAAPEAPPAGADPTTRRPARVSPPPAAEAPTSRRPARASTPPLPDAPTSRRPARATAPPATDAPTSRRPARADTGSGPVPTGSSPGSAGSSPAPAPEGSHGNRWIAIGGAAALLVVAVGIGALLSRGSDPNDRPSPGSTTAGPGATSATDVGIGDVSPQTPTVKVAAVTPKQVTFTWDREQEGDTFRYYVESLNGSMAQQPKPTDQPTATVAALPDGHTCLVVIALRGTLGSNPGKTCT